MAQSLNIFWVVPRNDHFLRQKGEVRPRSGSPLARLTAAGLRLSVLIPYDPNLLPKSKVSGSRALRFTVHLNDEYPVEVLRLTRLSNPLGVYMARLPDVHLPVRWAVFCKAALALARELGRPVDVFHLFGWETALLALFPRLNGDASPLFQTSRTFLTIDNLEEHGAFSAALMEDLGLPGMLFHSDGVEFYGRLSFLKTGVVFADGISVIDGPGTRGRAAANLRAAMRAVLAAQGDRVERWPSTRSAKALLASYERVLSRPPARSVVDVVLERASMEGQAPAGLPGPQGTNRIGFLVQSPLKGWAFWEWTGPQTRLGLMLIDDATGERFVIARDLERSGEYWFDLVPDRTCRVELVAFGAEGDPQTLLSSRPVRIPRRSLSENREAVFLDARAGKRVPMKELRPWEYYFSGQTSGATSAWEWRISGRDIEEWEHFFSEHERGVISSWGWGVSSLTLFQETSRT